MYSLQIHIYIKHIVIHQTILNRTTRDYITDNITLRLLLSIYTCTIDPKNRKLRVTH